MEPVSSDIPLVLLTATLLMATLTIFFISLVVTFQRKIRKKQEELYESVIKTQEEERMRIGRNLHDDTSPLLAAFKLYIQNEGKNDEWLDNLVKETIQSIRNASHNLSPPGLMENGFYYSIESLAMQLSRGGIEVGFDAGTKQRYINQIYSLHLYRIVSELVGNAVKHSGCSRIDVKVVEDNRHMKLLIMDNGKGMDKADADFPEGLGWQSIHNRLRLMSGNYSISSTKEGTTVDISIPLTKLSA